MIVDIAGHLETGEARAEHGWACCGGWPAVHSELVGGRIYVILHLLMVRKNLCGEDAATSGYD